MEVRFIDIFHVYHSNGLSAGDHHHRNHEMVYCLEGKGSVFICGRKYPFCTGNYYIIRAGTVHAEQDDSPCHIIYFYFDAPDELVPEGSYTDRSGSLLSGVKRLHSEAGTLLPYADALTDAIVMQLLVESVRTAQSESGSSIVELAVRYINANLEADIDFERLAAKYNYSYSRFRHIFKEQLGVSPYRYVTERRIEKAKFMFSIDADCSVTDVAFACGFATSSQFSSIFRTRVEMSPSEYLRQVHETP